MKKAILGTTALVAVGALAAAPASAAEKIALGVGGYMQSTYFYQNSDEPAGTPSRISDRVTQEGEIFFTGSTTLDNGLKVGVNVQLEAYQATDQIDETYIFIEGSFGRVLLGSEDSAAYLMHYTSPSPVPMYSADSANIYPTGQGNTTRPNLFSDTDKVTYFSPRFAGFQLGASYVPDGTSESGQHSQYAAPQYKSGNDRGYSVAANYVNKFGMFDLAVSAGYQSVDVNGASEDYSEYAFGASVGIAGFTVGGGYGVDKDIAGVKDDDRKAWSAGVTYGMGPWSVGVQYSKTTDEPAAGGDSDATTWIVGGQYTLGPGITAFGGVQFDDNDLAASTANRMAGDTQTFFVGTALSF
ncbi:porin [Sneathiella litorea]|uniref:Porin n=1 Tax=Sneathiella litorea TaxID=2606216 RepID=A0A6L8W6G6_9PROT|nr:porin [Sneathiella litorea]MZR29807.1 porin [Sneathiella litorea]